LTACVFLSFWPLKKALTFKSVTYIVTMGMLWLFAESSSVSMSETLVVLSELGRVRVFLKSCVTIDVGG
jgi:hypothetical protein